MADPKNSGVITFRPDDESATALAELTRTGDSASAAIRRALIATARAERDARLADEARALVADEEDLAEARAIMREMDAVRAR